MNTTLNTVAGKTVNAAIVVEAHVKANTVGVIAGAQAFKVAFTIARRMSLVHSFGLQLDALRAAR